MIKIHACSTCTDVCCERTRYALTNADIDRITQIIPRSVFLMSTVQTPDGMLRLRAPCPFYADHQCLIYSHRPLGCRIGPIVYNNGPAVDISCPGHTEVTAAQIARHTIILEVYMHTIHKEAQERLK